MRHLQNHKQIARIGFKMNGIYERQNWYFVWFAGVKKTSTAFSHKKLGLYRFLFLDVEPINNHVVVIPGISR